jgi:hypothetical protein
MIGRITADPISRGELADRLSTAGGLQSSDYAREGAYGTPAYAQLGARMRRKHV